MSETYAKTIVYPEMGDEPEIQNESRSPWLYFSCQRVSNSELQFFPSSKQLLKGLNLKKNGSTIAHTRANFINGDASCLKLILLRRI